MKNNFYVIEAPASNWEEAIALCAGELRKHNLVEDDFLNACVAREKEYPTGLECELGVAIPHTTADHVLENAYCVLRLPQPVPFYRMDDAEEQVDVHYVFNLAIADPQKQLDTLRAIMRIVQDGEYMRACEALPLDEFAESVGDRLFGAEAKG